MSQPIVPGSQDFKRGNDNDQDHVSTGAGLFAITVMSVGCTPSVDSVTVTQGGDVNLIRVEARVRGASAVSLQTPTVSIARVAGTQAPSFNRLGGHDAGDRASVHSRRHNCSTGA